METNARHDALVGRLVLGALILCSIRVYDTVDQSGYELVSLSCRVGLLLASLLELEKEKELLNLLATCVGETLVLAENPEPTFFKIRSEPSVALSGHFWAMG
jgi:hypothetical protein